MVPPGLSMWTMTALALELAEPFERLDALLIAADQPGDRDARDRAAEAAPVRPPCARHRGDRADGGDDDEHRQHTPERQFAPHAAAIDDLVRIERHRATWLRSS